MQPPKPVNQYSQLTDEQLRDELVVVFSHLFSAHRELGTLVSDQHRAYLEAYARSPGSSVAAKNREAQFQTQDESRDIIQLRALINSLTEARNLIVLLLNVGSVERNLYLVDHVDQDGLYG